MEKEDLYLTIKLDYILRECCIHKEEVDSIKKEIQEKNRERIHRVFKLQKIHGENFFSQYVSISKKEGQWIGSIYSSYTEFLQRLTEILNISFPVELLHDNELLTLSLENRIRLLRSIKKEEELKKYFPILHSDFLEGREKLRTLETKKQKEGSTEEIKEEERRCYAMGLRKGLANFITVQAQMYDRYIHQRTQYKEEVMRNPLQEILNDKIDWNRLLMLITDAYLNFCEQLPYFTKRNRKYMRELERYLSSNQWNKKQELHDDFGKPITIEILNQRMKALRRKWGENTRSADWDLIPEGRLEDTGRGPYTRKCTMTSAELRRLEIKGENRNLFYDCTNYQLQLVGKSKNRGYVAYVYPNGWVMLDRPYKPGVVSSASGNASYLVKAKDFEEYSKLDKKTLKQKEDVHVFSHTSTWAERVLSYLESEGTQEEQEQAKQLIKRYE